MSFKQSNLQPCAVCRKGMMHAGTPLFYRLRVERYGIDAAAVNRQHGLEMFFGKAAPLAAIIGPSEDIAKLIDGPREILICETCTHEHPAMMEAFMSNLPE